MPTELESIPVILKTAMGVDAWDIELPVTVPVAALLVKLVRAPDFGLREHDDDGNLVPYRLMWEEGSRYLSETETLKTAQVQAHHTLIVTQEARAGGSAAGAPTPADPPEAFAFRPVRRATPQDRPEDVPDYVLDELTRYALYVTDQVLNGVRLYARQFADVEVGGVLVGRHYQRGELTVVSVSNFVPLPSGDSSATHFVFDEQAIRTLHSQLKGADGYVVGWFHSHVRIGDPFMSVFDLRLHQDHFKQPWFVSCVVGGGEWAMPVGFWRMEGSKLLEIGEYFVRMTATTPLAEQSRRFFRACDAEERPLSKLLKRLDTLGHHLGLADESPVLAAFRKGIANSASAPLRSRAVEPLAALFDLATALSADLPVAEVRGFSDRLRHVDLLDDAIQLALKAREIPPRIAVRGDRCHAIHPGRSEIYQFNFVDNVFWPITLQGAPRLVDLAYSDDGMLYVLAQEGSLYCFPEESYLSPLLNPATGEVRTLVGRLILIPDLEPAPQAVCPCGEQIFLHCGPRVYRLHLNKSDPRNNPGIEPLPVDLSGWHSTVLLPLDGQLNILAVDDGTIARLDDSGRVLTRAPLPTHWRSWRLVDASAVSCGLFALFNNDGGQLTLLDVESLELIVHYIQDTPAQYADELTALAVDALGRCFLRKGRTICLLSASGAMPCNWYHYQASFE
jgi:proteasome lid subunit RPN8/RPN11